MTSNSKGKCVPGAVTETEPGRCWEYEIIFSELEAESVRGIRHPSFHSPNLPTVARTESGDYSAIMITWEDTGKCQLGNKRISVGDLPGSDFLTDPV